MDTTHLNSKVLIPEQVIDNRFRTRIDNHGVRRGSGLFVRIAMAISGKTGR